MGCTIGDEECKAVAQILAKNKALVRLSLRILCAQHHGEIDENDIQTSGATILLGTISAAGIQLRSLFLCEPKT